MPICVKLLTAPTVIIVVDDVAAAVDRQLFQHALAAVGIIVPVGIDRLDGPAGGGGVAAAGEFAFAVVGVTR